jgi:radical SAM protein with 4Fe4S-binding SPASM domain
VFFDRDKLAYRFLDSAETGQISPAQVEYRTGAGALPRGVLSAPVRVYFEITRLCNLRCRQCFTSSGSPLDGELSFEECLRVLDGLRRDNVLEVRITGGEPTQKEGWERLIDHALKIGLVVTLNTNGVYPVAVQDKIIALRPDQVLLSLDGPPQVHEALRGKGSFAPAFETLRALHGGGVPVRVSTLLTREVLPYLEAMVLLVEPFAVELCFMQLKPIGRGGRLLKSLPSFKEVFQADQQLKALRQFHPELKISTSYDLVAAGATRPAPDLDLSSCAAGLRGCNIDCLGDIFICGFQEELGSQFKLGSLRAEGFSLLEIWRSNPYLQAFRSQNLKKTATCQACAYLRDPCFGSCIIMEQYRQTRSPDGKDPYCLKERHGE